MVERDDELRAAFADLERRTRQHTRLAETPALHAVARGRIRRRMAAIAASVVLAVLVPAVTAAVVLRQSVPPPAFPPPVTASPAPSPGPTQPPGQSMRMLGPLRPLTELDNALLDLPAWDLSFCSVGPTQFEAGTWRGEPVGGAFTPVVTIRDVVAGDVTGDGTPDVVAYLSCDAGTDPGGVADQVLAYARRGPGEYDLLGPVARAAGGTEHLRIPRVEQGGTVSVVHVSTPEVHPPIAAELRHYRWDSGTFRPVGSPTTVDLMRRPTRLLVSVNATPLVGSTASGLTSTLTVTVANGGGPGSPIELHVRAEGPITAVSDHTGTPLDRVDGQGGRSWVVLIEGVLAEEAVTGAFTIQVSGDDLAQLGRSTPMTVWLQARDVAGFPLDVQEGYEQSRAATFGLLNPS